MRPFLLIEDSYADVQAFMRLVKRIGLVNPVSVQATVESAQETLSASGADRLPVIIFAGTQMRGGHSLAVLDWVASQEGAAASIPTIAILDVDDEAARQRASAQEIATVGKPVDMHELIAAMKTLGLAEKVKIDPTTLMVQVELCPRGEGAP